MQSWERAAESALSVGHEVQVGEVFDCGARRMAQYMKYLIEVEKERQATDGKPSRGPVYRSSFAKDGFPAPVEGMDCCWDIFRCVLFLLPLALYERTDSTTFLLTRDEA